MGEFTVSSGDKLHWYEFGDSSGFPVLYFHGLFGSAFEAAQCDEYAQQLGIRVLAPDLPGFYVSSIIPAYTLSSYMDLISQWLEHLQINRFSVFGLSGGAVFALAVAHRFSDNVDKVSVVSSTAPFETTVMQQYMNTELKPLYDVTLANRDLAIEKFTPLGASVEALLGAFEPLLSQSDKDLMKQAKIMENVFESCSRALVQGVGAYVDSIRVIRLPWSFDLSDIVTPVTVWQGMDDLLVPPQIGEYLAHRIHFSKYQPVDAGGHFCLYSIWYSVLSDLK